MQTESSVNLFCEDSERTNRKEKLWVCAIACLAVLLLLLPYWLGYVFARPDLEPTGVIMNPEDSQSYFAKMLQGYDGYWLYRIPFTTEEHTPAFIGGFYLLLGHLARSFGLSLVAMWHLARTLAALIMFLAIFSFIARFLPDTRARWIAYLLAIFGSGLGWLLFLLNQPTWLDWTPVDFKMPEAHPFFSALTFPHIAISTALLLASFWLTLEAFINRYRWLCAVGAGLINFATAIVFPFLIFLIAAVLGIYWVILAVQARRVLYREALIVAVTLVIPMPLVVYYSWTLASNSVFRTWDAQAITLSPPAPHYLIAYGVMILLALLSWRRRRANQIFLWAWLIAAALLVYAPHPQQRRFVQGVQIPLAILATVGWVQVVLPWLAQTRVFRWIISHPRYTPAGLERLLSIVFVLTMSLSNGYVLSSVTLTAMVEQPYPLFRMRDEIAAVDWLRANTARTDVVLSAYETGNYIAARAGNYVWIGHWTETVAWDSKLKEVEKFYSATTADEERTIFLRDQRIAYIFWGPAERKLGAFDPMQTRYWERVFANTNVQIFRVRAP
jgi:hypothetical protein